MQMNLIRTCPSFDEVVEAILSFEQDGLDHARSQERIGVTIRGDLILMDRTRIPIRLRDLSLTGMGFFHIGPIVPGKVRIHLAVNSYLVDVKWCYLCQNQLYISGGPILSSHPIVPSSKVVETHNPWGVRQPAQATQNALNAGH